MNSELRITGINPNPQNPQRGPFNNPDDNEDTNQEHNLMEEKQEDSFVLSKNERKKRQIQIEKQEPSFTEKLKKLISSLMGFGEILDNKETENV